MRPLPNPPEGGIFSDTITILKSLPLGGSPMLITSEYVSDGRGLIKSKVIWQRLS